MNTKPLRPARRKIEGVKDQVGPLFITQWAQKAPFNNKCPELRGERCITGCIAISTSQTLYYYQYPDSAKGVVNYVSRTNQIPIQEDLSAFKFNWPDIKSIYKLLINSYVIYSVNPAPDYEVKALYRYISLV